MRIRIRIPLKYGKKCKKYFGFQRQNSKKIEKKCPNPLTSKGKNGIISIL
jgi:hypothetical protein